MKPAPKVWSVVVKSGGCSGRTRKGFGKGYIPTHNLSNSHIHGDFFNKHCIRVWLSEERQGFSFKSDVFSERVTEMICQLAGT